MDEQKEKLTIADILLKLLEWQKKTNEIIIGIGGVSDESRQVEHDCIYLKSSCSSIVKKLIDYGGDRILSEMTAKGLRIKIMP